MCVTGTPALSRPAELFMQLKALMPDTFRAFHPFAGPFGLDVSGSSNASELKMILEEVVMIRRLKEEVLSDMLPDKDRQIVDVPTDAVPDASKSPEKDPPREPIAVVPGKVAELMEQKEDIQRAMSRSPSDSEMMELRAALHAVTSKLYSASGKAKIKGVLAHLQALLKAGNPEEEKRDIEAPSSPLCDTSLSDHSAIKLASAPPAAVAAEAVAAVASSTAKSSAGDGIAGLLSSGSSSSSGGCAGAGASSGWTCKRCTYDNASSRRKCEMCQESRPKMSDLVAGGERGEQQQQRRRQRPRRGGADPPEGVEDREGGAPGPARGSGRGHAGDVDSVPGEKSMHGGTSQLKLEGATKGKVSTAAEAVEASGEDAGTTARRRRQTRSRTDTKVKLEDGEGGTEARPEQLDGGEGTRPRPSPKGAGKGEGGEDDEAGRRGRTGRAAAAGKKRSGKILDPPSLDAAAPSNSSEESIEVVCVAPPSGSGRRGKSPLSSFRRLTKSRSAGSTSDASAATGEGKGNRKSGGGASVAGRRGEIAAAGSAAASSARDPRKLVVFAHHKEVLDTLEMGLKKLGICSVRIDGGTPQHGVGKTGQSAVGSRDRFTSHYYEFHHRFMTS
eukprot:jgi/Undpi1/9575/HiC_scaffold_27.g12031.m1